MWRKLLNCLLPWLCCFRVPDHLETWYTWKENGNIVPWFSLEDYLQSHSYNSRLPLWSLTPVTGWAAHKVPGSFPKLRIPRGRFFPQPSVSLAASFQPKGFLHNPFPDHKALDWAVQSFPRLRIPHRNFVLQPSVSFASSFPNSRSSGSSSFNTNPNAWQSHGAGAPQHTETQYAIKVNSYC